VNSRRRSTAKHFHGSDLPVECHGCFQRTKRPSGDDVLYERFIHFQNGSLFNAGRYFYSGIGKDFNAFAVYQRVGSFNPITTFFIPFPMTVSVQGGVFPLCEQGSMVTYKVAPFTLSVAFSMALISACGPPK